MVWRGPCCRHVTKCILITEQQMSRMEPLCCLNSRNLHFCGFTSHCIHLPASCQFKGGKDRERESEIERERENLLLWWHVPEKGGGPQRPWQLVICIRTYTFRHKRSGGAQPALPAVWKERCSVPCTAGTNFQTESNIWELTSHCKSWNGTSTMSIMSQYCTVKINKHVHLTTKYEDLTRFHQAQTLSSYGL